ncbi:antibiotic biosynthesis monooxygenase [Kiloniella laminariae]|uniref:Antibiotic biosynthesis monooxygenase n=1 Tax=Kiloniella laminariae TaxID=454162 RepID=A0ABT4LM41_9PROT|nr:antibiotic biosynthesis monooxygenase [Kiloniella laminariae]MCZ4281446.1 antibiotic biosynthesis monooxygenase [Kiloniella laminariae]
MLWISAGIEVQDHAEIERARTELEKLVAATQHEPDCFKFEILQNIEKPQCFTLWECWADADALKAHFETTHTKAYLALGLTEVNYIERLESCAGGAMEQAA